MRPIHKAPSTQLIKRMIVALELVESKYDIAAELDRTSKLMTGSYKDSNALKELNHTSKEQLIASKEAMIKKLESLLPAPKISTHRNLIKGYSSSMGIRLTEYVILAEAMSSAMDMYPEWVNYGFTAMGELRVPNWELLFISYDLCGYEVTRLYSLGLDIDGVDKITRAICDTHWASGDKGCRDLGIKSSAGEVVSV